MAMLMTVLKVAIIISAALIVLSFGLSKFCQYVVKKGLETTPPLVDFDDMKLFDRGIVQATRTSKRWLVVSLILIAVYIVLNWLLK